MSYPVPVKGTGLPDYAALSPLGQKPAGPIYTLVDLGELAARLGSIDTFDRRGNVIWMDDFESGIGQWIIDGNVGYSVDWDGNRPKTGGFSCKLTTGPVTDDNIYIQKYIGFPVLSAMGIECSFSGETNWKYLDTCLQLYDGTDFYAATIRYDHVNYKLQYVGADNDYHDIVGGSWACGEEEGYFDTLKFVADFTTGKYKRLLINNQAFDLSKISFYKVAQTAKPLMLALIQLFTGADAAAIGYIDDVIITQNEP